MPRSCALHLNTSVQDKIFDLKLNNFVRLQGRGSRKALCLSMTMTQEPGKSDDLRRGSDNSCHAMSQNSDKLNYKDVIYCQLSVGRLTNGKNMI